MLSNANMTAKLIKDISINAIASSMPSGIYFGVVKSAEPLEIEVDQKFVLTEDVLVLSTLVQDFDVQMYMEHETEETDLTHKHNISPSSVCAYSGAPLSGLISIMDSPNSDNHKHEYTGVKTFTVNLRLKKDEKVILLRVQGGQKFIVLDRVRVLNDTDNTSKFD